MSTKMTVRNLCISGFGTFCCLSELTFIKLQVKQNTIRGVPFYCFMSPMSPNPQVVGGDEASSENSALLSCYS